MTRRLCLLFVVALTTLLFNVAEATNQPMPWPNPPCGTATIVNLSGCSGTLTLNLAPVGTTFGPVAVPTGTSIVATPAMNVLGVKTNAGNNVPIMLTPMFPPVSPPLFPPISSPANGWAKGVTIAPGCCVDIYFYPTNDPNYPCHIFLYPGTAPCVP